MAYLILSFAGIHDALAAERLAAGAELLPLPPAIKSDCGYGLFIDIDEGGPSLAARLASLREAGLRWEAAYRAAGGSSRSPYGKETIYERIDEAH